MKLPSYITSHRSFTVVAFMLLVTVLSVTGGILSKYSERAIQGTKTQGNVLAAKNVALGGSIASDSDKDDEKGGNPSPSGTANPSFGVLAPCPSCVSPTMTLTPSNSVVLPSNGAQEPSQLINNPNQTEPCATGASVAHSKKSKHKEHNGAISGFMEALIRFFLELLNLLLSLLGGGEINIPNQPNENNSQSKSRHSEPCPMPEESPSPSEPFPSTTQPVASLIPSLDISPSSISPSTTNVPVGSKVVFVGDYNTNNFSQWNSCQWKGRNSSCSAYSGGDYMAKIVNDGPGHETAAQYEVRSGDQPEFGGERAEVRASNGADVKEGDERWYEFSLKFPSDFQNPVADWFIVTQWHAGEGSPPLALQVSKNGVLQFSNNRTGKTTDIAPIQRGSWVSYVLHVKFSSGSSALAESWVNGVKQPGIHQEPNMASGSNYLKQGIYRGDQSLTHVVLHDGLRITAP